MLKFITNPGLKRELSGTTGTIKDTISISAALYLIFAVLFYPEPILHRSIAFGLFYSVIFIGYASPGTKSGFRVPVADWILSALSLGVSIYIGLNFERISSRLVFVDQVLASDIVFGFLTIFLLVEGTRRVMGPWLPGLSLLALAYIFWGHHIQGRFGHLKLSTEYIIDGMFLSNYGIWGSTLGIAAGKVMVFLLFGTLFKNTGAGDFLFALVSRITGRVKGGVGKV
ncbi:MAG: TRAP transporter large permease subunit, partial [Clostridia bacterium]|nr:TRAP transporter large permease subunit [Clostridia bacterium]